MISATRHIVLSLNYIGGSVPVDLGNLTKQLYINVNTNYNIHTSEERELGKNAVSLRKSGCTLELSETLKTLHPDCAGNCVC